MPKFIAAIDQGTTSTRCMIFDHGGNVMAVDQKEHRQMYPRPGWVEHDALEIWQRTREVIDGALQKGSISAGDVLALGITNQRETTVVWEKETGMPIHIAEDPLDSVALGSGKCVEEFEALQQVLDAQPRRQGR